MDGPAAPYSLLLENTADPVNKTLEFKTQAYKRMQNFLKKHSNNEAKATPSDSEHDTVVYPVIQMAPLGIRQDENTTLRILDIIHEHGKTVEDQDYWNVHLTSGYFNFTNRYKEYILRTAAKFEFLTASPKVCYRIKANC